MSQALLTQKLKSLSLHRGESRISKYGFGFLNIAQALGSLNDNLFKLLTTFLLIDLHGDGASKDILILIGIAFVLPFLLFSSTGGVLADRYSKQKVIVLLKAFEVVIIACSFIAYHYKCSWMCYSLVFMLTMQSALMTPSKYSIIPEIVRKDHIPKANGMMTSFTYLAIIFGTFLASFMTQLTGRNFILANLSCLVASIIGFIASLYIPPTKARASSEKMSPLFLSQVIKTLKYCRRTPRLILVVCSSAFFLFIGGFLQINMIPFALETLHLDSVSGGYLFSMTAIGIAIGAVIGAKACKKELDLGLSCFSLFSIGALLMLIPLFGTTIFTAIIALTLLGFFGGMFVVPMETYIQAFSSSEVRGQVVATQNFLSFIGVLLAPLALAFFGKVLGISAVTAFFFVGAIVLLVFGLLLKNLSGSFFHFISRKFLQPFYKLHFMDTYPFGPQHQEDKIAIVFKQKSFLELALLLGESPRIQIFLIKTKKRFLHQVFSFFSNIEFLYTDLEEKPDPAHIKSKIEKFPFTRPIFVFSNSKTREHFDRHLYFDTLQTQYNYQIKHFSVKNTSHFKPRAINLLRRTQKTFSFEGPKKKLLSHHKKRQLAYKR